MKLASAAKRLTCEQCLRPLNACICRWITPTAHAVEVVLLQHPSEEHSAKGSARLLHLSLPRSRMVVGETFAEREVHALLHDPSRLRLIVLDGTWRKSRKLLQLNPLLRTLPRLSLNEVPQSRYLIRKAHRANQLSTLEATCFALAQIEGDAERFDPLLRAFDGFVAQQMGYRPEITGGRRPETRFD